MSCLNNWMMILLIVCFPLVYSQAILKLSETKPYDCKMDISMTCTVTGVACCTGFTRFWRKDNNLIMTDGVETVALGKYSEKVNSADNNFVLTIRNLDKEEDSGQEFTCSYQADTSPAFKFESDDILCPPCWICIAICLACTLGGMIGVYLLQYTSLLCSSLLTNLPCHNNCSVSNNDVDSHYIFCGKDYVISKKKKSLLIAIIVNLVGLILYGLIPGLCFGWFCYICYVGLAPLLLLFALGALLFIVIFYWTLEFHSDENFSIWRYLGYVALTFLILPLIVLVPYMCCKGGKSQSVESGSSCWPICRVGQDPNTSSSNPEKVRRSPKKERADKKPAEFVIRSPEKERADKKKDRKPTEIVRPQPSRPLPPMHLKTDNTGRAEYSTEPEIFKPPVLPSISQASDSPRPLPPMPLGTQPVDTTTSERKKKKKSKKKEAKQSDKDNSTEL